MEGGEVNVRTVAATMSIISKMTGGPLNISKTDTDTNYAYRRFDAFGIRPNRTKDSAGEIDISEFRVEVIPAPVSVTRFPITSVNIVQPNSLVLNFTSVATQNYQVQSTPTLSPPAWMTNATITAVGTATSYTNTPLSGNSRFYRVVAVP